MMPMVDVLTPPSPQSTCSCCIGSRRLSTGGCAPSPVSPSPTKKVTPSPITRPSVPDVCASITNKRSCKRSRSAGCKWKKSSQTCSNKSDRDSKSGKGGKRGKSSKKLFE